MQLDFDSIASSELEAQRPTGSGDTRPQSLFRVHAGLTLRRYDETEGAVEETVSGHVPGKQGGVEVFPTASSPDAARMDRYLLATGWTSKPQVPDARSEDTILFFDSTLEELSHELTSTVEVSDEKGSVDAEASRLALRLSRSFEMEPLENGMNHPAENLLADAIRRPDNGAMIARIAEWCHDESRPEFASSVFQCVARQEDPGTHSWRVAIVRRALNASQVQIRDAAVRAVDSWEDPQLLPLLETHKESVPWLARYIRAVVDDLR